MNDDNISDIPELPHGPKGSGVARGTLNVVGGLIPFAGGLLAAAASAWSENEQHKINDFLHHWIQMLAAEMREKQQTILEILSRIDMRDEETAKRVESPAYQTLMRKLSETGREQRARQSGQWFAIYWSTLQARVLQAMMLLSFSLIGWIRTLNSILR